MIIRTLALVSVAIAAASFVTADEAINKAYFERGLETSKIIKEDAKKFIVNANNQLKAVRNGIKEEDGKPYFLQTEGVWTFHYVTKDQKQAAEKRELEQIRYYTGQLHRSFQVPRINVFGVDVPTGAVGLLDNIGKFDSTADPPHYYKVRVSELDDNGFLADVHFGNAKKVYFQGFDKSKVALDTVFEITDVVLVVGPTDTSFGRYLTIRKLTEQELYEAQKYAEAHMPNPNVREWSDSAGKFKIKAEFLAIDGGTVTLKKDDGTEIKVPQSKLSKADRDWLKENRTDD